MKRQEYDKVNMLILFTTIWISYNFPIIFLSLGKSFPWILEIRYGSDRNSYQFVNSNAVTIGIGCEYLLFGFDFRASAA